MSLQEIRLANQDRFALRRWWMGMPQHPDVQPVSALVARMIATMDSNKAEHRQLAEQFFCDQLGDIFKTDPNNPPITKAEDTYVPPLPTAARLSPAALEEAGQVGGWYKGTVKWLTERSPMTPQHFLEMGTAWLIGLAVNRRVCIEVHEPIYPTLYCLIVAETSRYAKSTGLKALDTIVFHSMPHMLIPGSTTTEGMTELLSGEKPVNFDKLSARDQLLIEAGQEFAGQRGILLDEYSSLLGSIKKDYMHGFIELLMALYDAPPHVIYHTKAGGMKIIHYPALSILGATTPSSMARALNHEQWTNGAMARYLIMFRETALKYNDEYSAYTPPKSITEPIASLHKSLPRLECNDRYSENEQQFTPMYAQLGTGVIDCWRAYSKAVRFDLVGDEVDERLNGNYQRLHVQALKIALGIAVMDWQQGGQKGPIIIELGHWALGQMLAEKGRASLHRLLPVLSESADTRTRKSLVAVLKAYPEGLTLTEIGDRLGLANKDIRSAIEILVDSDQAEYVKINEGIRGRPTGVYRLLS